jgi:hypothetical protein
MDAAFGLDRYFDHQLDHRYCRCYKRQCLCYGQQHLRFEFRQYTCSNGSHSTCTTGYHNRINCDMPGNIANV